jgi:hypothetical protein
MKNKILAFLFLLPLFAQAQTVTVSETISTRDDDYYKVIPGNRGNVLLFSDKQTKFEVKGFDGNLREKWKKELELDKKRPELIEVVPMGGDFCLFYQFRKKGDPVLKAHHYSSSANLRDSVTLKVLDMLFYTPNYQVVVSEDKKVALIYFVEQSNEFTVFSFHMGRMKLLWETNFTLDNFIFQRDFIQMLVDDGGNMHLVLSRQNRRSRQDEHYLEVFEVGEATQGIHQRYIVPMQGHLTYHALFSFDNMNKCLVAAGLYSGDNFARADGYFFLSVAQSNHDDQVLRFHPFEDDFVNILTEKEKAKNKGLAEVNVQEIVHRRDGGILFAGELNKQFQRGVVTDNYYSRTAMRPIVDYYYDDLFLVSIHPDGEEHWKTILYKKQYSQDDDAIYSSYFLAKTPAALRVIFNDEIKQENTVSEYIVSGNGDYEHSTVMNTERKELSLLFRDAVQVAANEIIVPSERRSRLKLVKIVY